MPHPLPLAYQGPAAQKKLSRLKDIPTTKRYDTNKDQFLTVAIGQMKGEWAPIVCRKVPSAQQTSVLAGQLREGTGLSEITPNSPPGPQQFDLNPDDSNL